VSTLDGQLTFFSTNLSKQTNIIEGRKDISGGRKADDRVAASNSASSKAFTSVTWNADGSCVLAGGNSKYVALYDAREGVLIRRWQISENLSLDGTEEFLDSRRVTEAGNIDLIDDRGEESDLEDRLDVSLPACNAGTFPSVGTRGKLERSVFGFPRRASHGLRRPQKGSSSTRLTTAFHSILSTSPSN